MNETKFAIFAETYRNALASSVAAHPEDYPWAHNVPVEVVAERMIDAVRKRTFNKDGRAFKLTCKALGIPHTYKAIDAYLERT